MLSSSNHRAQLAQAIRDRGLPVLEIESRALGADDALAGRQRMGSSYGGTSWRNAIWSDTARKQHELHRIYLMAYRRWRKARQAGTLGELVNELRPHLEYWMSADAVLQQKFKYSTIAKLVFEGVLVPQPAIPGHRVKMPTKTQVILLVLFLIIAVMFGIIIQSFVLRRFG